MRARCHQCPDVALKNRIKRSKHSDGRLSQQHRPEASNAASTSGEQTTHFANNRTLSTAT
jgi:hypothetical protein